MMFITMIARLSCNICCFLYPAYASYKALSLGSSPEGIEDVERWLMYWSVVGSWTATEAVAGWAFTWLPFYSVIKTGVFLWLSLPQSEGSSYIYRNHLAPLFYEHERDIDSFLNSLRGRATTALAGGVGWLWDIVKSQLNLALPTAPPQGQHHTGYVVDPHEQFASGQQQPPSLQDPASGAAQQIYGFMTHYAGRYGPLALSAISAAASSAKSSKSRQADPAFATQVPETMSMPVPRPNSTPSDPNLRSRTYQQAQQALQASAAGVSSARQSRRVSTPSGGPSQRNSEESLHTGGSGSSSSRLEMSGYEQIERDDVPPESLLIRPGMEKRGSSWFGSWAGGATPTRQKAE